jgi:hypothetical protein
MQWEVALTRDHRRNLDIRRLLGSQSVSQRIEYLPLGKSAGPRKVVGRQVFRTGDEAADTELLRRISDAVEKSKSGWVISGDSVAFTARVAEDQAASHRNPFLQILRRRHRAGTCKR